MKKAIFELQNTLYNYGEILKREKLWVTAFKLIMMLRMQ